MSMAYTTNQHVGQVRVQAIRMLKAGKSTREVARHFGYAQSTVVKWNKRKNEIWHQKSLPTRSSRPKTSPAALDHERVAQIIAVRLKTHRCAEVVAAQLKRDGVHVSLSSVKRTLARHGLLKKRSPWKKRRLYPLRPDIAKPGDLIELDTIHLVDKNGTKTYVYTAIDVFSRYGYAQLSGRANTHASLKFLKKCQAYFPFQMQVLQTDNGPEFGTFFTDGAMRRGMRHRHNHPRSPNENGHLERFNRTLQEEPFKQDLCLRKAEDLLQYLQYYNLERVHMGIGYKIPVEMLSK